MFWFKYNNEIWTFDPNLQIPCDEFDPDGNPIPGYGQTLKEFLGMTEEEANTALLEGKWNAIRSERDIRLSKCDWTQGADVPDNIKIKYQNYRQRLRDITTQPTPEDIIWPVNPDND